MNLWLITMVLLGGLVGGVAVLILAYRLLNDGRYRVNEVAYRLGYTSPSQFSRRFRTFYHCAPTEVGNRRAG